MQLLIRLKDNLRPNSPRPELAYRPGDIVFVADDNHEWGKQELSDRFAIIHLPISKNKAEEYMEEDREADPLPYDPHNYKIVRRRKWQIRIADLSPSIRNKLGKEKVVIDNREWNTFRSVLFNKRTQKIETRNLGELQ